MSVGVLFVIDCTGSMERIHRYLGKSLAKIVEMFADESVPVEFACMGFRDYKADPKSAFEMTDFYGNNTRLVRWLNNVRSYGGGSNFGESSLSAMVHGVQEVDWPDVKRRVIALFTDDKPHLEDYGVDGWDGAKRVIANAGIEQIHLFTINRKIDSYDDLDDHEYVVIRHKLAENNLDEMVEEDLEIAMRDFVKVSSSGTFGDAEIIIRDDDDFDVNPFDYDDDEDEEDAFTPTLPTFTETPELPDSGDLDVDWDDLG